MFCRFSVQIFGFGDVMCRADLMPSEADGVLRVYHGTILHLIHFELCKNLLSPQASLCNRK